MGEPGTAHLGPSTSAFVSSFEMARLMFPELFAFAKVFNIKCIGVERIATEALSEALGIMSDSKMVWFGVFPLEH